MALSLEVGNLAWQKVKLALMDANPAVQAMFAGLKTYLAQQKGNINLQFIPFGDADLVQATGYSPIGVGCTVYGVWIKKNGTGVGTSTDSWLTVGNAATNTVDATKFIALMTQAADDEAVAVYPNGLVFGTDLTLTGETSAQDGTESSSGDSGSGFILIGA